MAAHRSPLLVDVVPENDLGGGSLGMGDEGSSLDLEMDQTATGIAAEGDVFQLKWRPRAVR